MIKYIHWFLSVGFSLILFLVLGSGQAVAQGAVKKYLVYFRDKQGNNPYSLTNPSAYLSPRAIQRRIRQNLPLDSTDIPVSPSYLSAIENLGVRVLYSLRWQNAAIISSTPGQLSQVSALPFVVNSQPLESRAKSSPMRRKFKEGIQSLEYGLSFPQNSQIGIDSMHMWGFHGENMLIAVMDAGFRNVNGHAAFAHLFEENKIIGTRDLVDRDGDVYLDHWHGAAVLSNIAAKMPGKLYGGAYEASYYLLRTEDAATEYEIECAYWAVGLELADSAGVDLVNSSLGYSTFDNAVLNYSFNVMDGATTIASKQAAMAAGKGMIVINSAGNEGNNLSWEGRISVPGDAPNILTVGAINGGGNVAGFSGKGPTFDGRIKPDLVALGAGAITANVFTSSEITSNSGTSFSAPIICGLVAGFWQANPTLTAMQVMQWIKASGSNQATPNNSIGWGIPNFVRAYILSGAKPILSFPVEVQVFPNPVSDAMLNIELQQSAAVGWATLNLFDANGKQVLQDRVYFDASHQSHSLSLSGVQKGVYTFQIEMGGKRLIKKVVLY